MCSLLLSTISHDFFSAQMFVGYRLSNFVYYPLRIVLNTIRLCLHFNYSFYSFSYVFSQFVIVYFVELHTRGKHESCQVYIFGGCLTEVLFHEISYRAIDYGMKQYNDE